MTALTDTGFSRWTLSWTRTWAYRLFKSHHTELNSLYWAHVPALRYAFAATRGADPEAPTSALFTVEPDDLTRIGLPLKAWGQNYAAFDNWVRLNALVGITGYLEVYLKTVTRLALESDPGLLIGAPRAVDGVRQLKAKSKYEYKDEVVPCVRGSWPERVAHYRRLFGYVPPLL